MSSRIPEKPIFPLLIMQEPSSILNTESADSIHTPAFEWENEI